MLNVGGGLGTYWFGGRLGVVFLEMCVLACFFLFWFFVCFVFFVLVFVGWLLNFFGVSLFVV